MKEQILEAGSQWMVTHRGTDDPAILGKIVHRVEELIEEQGGYPSVSHFERAYIELRNAGELPKIEGAFQLEQKPSFDREFLAYIERTSAFEQSRRYKTDPIFRAKFDAYQKQTKREAINVPNSAAEYHQIPARVVAARYQKEPGFRRAIDALVARGEI
jgi:hypothetical protein